MINKIYILSKMMKCFFKLVILYGIHQQVISHTSNKEERVSALRHKLKKQIREVQLKSKLDEPQEFMDNYDLIVGGEPAEVLNKQPHLRSGHRHRHRVRKHREGASTNVTSTTNTPQTTASITEILPVNSTTSNVIDDSFETHVRILEEKVETAIANLTNYLNQSDTRNILTTTYSPRRENPKVTPRIPFYRKFNFLHDSERKKPQKWVHCLDLITPKLQGIKDASKANMVTSTHADVMRLTQLLYTNVTTFNAQDMVSLLSQISKIRIRMYHWDQNAITMTLNVIIKGPIHSFKTLKEGVKILIAKWHLDVSNMKVFLEQSRIFRPPCIDITGYSGFTKKPGGVIPYTKPDKPKKKRDPDVSCHSREKHEPYDNNHPPS